MLSILGHCSNLKILNDKLSFLNFRSKLEAEFSRESRFSNYTGFIPADRIQSPGSRPGSYAAETVPIAPQAIPAPPAPVSAGPPPADTVVPTKIAAPVRTHTRIIPQVTNIVPQVNVQKYNVAVPCAVPYKIQPSQINNVDLTSSSVGSSNQQTSEFSSYSSQAKSTERIFKYLF